MPASGLAKNRQRERHLTGAAAVTALLLSGVSSPIRQMTRLYLERPWTKGHTHARPNSVPPSDRGLGLVRRFTNTLFRVFFFDHARQRHAASNSCHSTSTQTRGTKAPGTPDEFCKYESYKFCAICFCRVLQKLALRPAPRNSFVEKSLTS